MSSGAVLPGGPNSSINDPSCQKTHLQRPQLHPHHLPTFPPAPRTHQQHTPLPPSPLCPPHPPTTPAPATVDTTIHAQPVSYTAAVLGPETALGPSLQAGPASASPGPPSAATSMSGASGRRGEGGLAGGGVGGVGGYGGSDGGTGGFGADSGVVVLDPEVRIFTCCAPSVVPHASACRIWLQRARACFDIFVNCPPLSHRHSSHPQSVVLPSLVIPL